MAITFVASMMMRDLIYSAQLVYSTVSYGCCNDYYDAVSFQKLGTSSAYMCESRSRAELDIVKLCDGVKDCPSGDDETNFFCESELIILQIVGSSSTKGVSLLLFCNR